MVHYVPVPGHPGSWYDPQNPHDIKRNQTRNPNTPEAAGRQPHNATTGSAQQGQLNLNAQGVGAAHDMLANPGNMLQSQDAQSMMNATYGAEAKNFEDLNSQSQEQMQQQLINSGNGPGTPLYDQQMRNFQNQANNQRQQWMNSAIQSVPGMLQANASTANTLGNIGASYGDINTGKYQGQMGKAALESAANQIPVAQLGAHATEAAAAMKAPVTP